MTTLLMDSQHILYSGNGWFLYVVFYVSIQDLLITNLNDNWFTLSGPVYWMLNLQKILFLCCEFNMDHWQYIIFLGKKWWYLRGGDVVVPLFIQHFDVNELQSIGAHLWPPLIGYKCLYMGIYITIYIMVFLLTKVNGWQGNTGNDGDSHKIQHSTTSGRLTSSMGIWCS